MQTNNYLKYPASTSPKCLATDTDAFGQLQVIYLYRFSMYFTLQNIPNLAYEF